MFVEDGQLVVGAPYTPASHGAVMGWTAPKASMCQNEVAKISDRGAVRGRDYPNWHRHVEALFSAAWRKRDGAGGIAEEVAAQRITAVFGKAASDGDRPGSVRRFALLGA